MTERFLKFIPGERAEWLLQEYPNAYLLLSLIAMRARRENGHPDGLIIGDAILGDPKSAGLKPKEYRNAIEKLAEFRFIQKVHNGKKFVEGQKRAIRRAIKSWLVNLIDSTIWDINPIIEGEQKGKLGANKGQTEGDKQEGIRKNKKEEEKKNIKKKVFSFAEIVCVFGEYVELTKAELEELIAQFGHELVMWKIRSMEHHVGENRNGKRYKKIKSVLHDWCEKDRGKIQRLPLPSAAPPEQPKMGRKPKLPGAQNEA